MNITTSSTFSQYSTYTSTSNVTLTVNPTQSTLAQETLGSFGSSPPLLMGLNVAAVLVLIVLVALIIRIRRQRKN
jgi:hypothetical protein